MQGKPWRRVLAGATLVIIVVGVVWFGRYSVARAGTDPLTYQIDFNVYYIAWQSVLQTLGNPYAEQISPATPYLYPPLFAQLLAPLGWLSLTGAAWAWYLINVLAVLFSLVLAQRLVRRGAEASPLDYWFLLLTFGAIARFALDNWRMGQINPLLVALVLLGLYLYERKHEWWAALFLATAISFKLTPALFIIYFLLKGRWRFALQTSVVAGLLNVLSFLPMGRQAPEVFQYWFNLIILNKQGFGWGYHGNQSWRALVHRLLTEEHTGASHLPHINLAVQHTAADLLYYAGVSTILAAIVWAARRPEPALTRVSAATELPAARALEYSLVFCGMLMISSLSWKDHYIALLLPYAALLQFVRGARNERARLIAGSLLLGSFMLCTLTNMELIGRYWSETLEVFSAVFLGVVALFSGLLYIRLRGLYVATETEISNQFGPRVEERLRA